MGAENRFSFLKLLDCILHSKAKTGVILSSLVLLSCGGNLFEPMSTKTTHAALLQDIKDLVNDLKFSEAVAIIEANPTLVITDRSEKMTLAAAYAGACGLTFLDVFESLSTASGSPMYFMMSAFTSKAVDAAKCYKAQQWIESIGAVGARTANENIAMFLIGFGKVGSYLRAKADTSASGIGDGVVDATFDSCDNTDLPRAEIKQVITGFGLMIQNITALGSNVSASLTTDINNLTLACTALGMDCTQTNPSAISDADADRFRDAIKSDSTTQIGIEDCDPLLPTCCP